MNSINTATWNHAGNYLHTDVKRGKGNGATKRELAEVIFALARFRYYIWGFHFTLYTSHNDAMMNGIKQQHGIMMGIITYYGASKYLILTNAYSLRCRGSGMQSELRFVHSQHHYIQ
jgi:hypothetical protein